MPADDELRWTKSSRSAGYEACVEVAIQPDGSVWLRASKAGDSGPILRFTPAEWRAFVAGVHEGEFDD